MSESPGRGSVPTDPLEALLRATGQDMDYPATPPLAAGVRARLEREGATPRLSLLRRLGLRRGPGPDAGSGLGGRGQAAWALRWAAPGAVAAAVAVLVWLRLPGGPSLPASSVDQPLAAAPAADSFARPATPAPAAAAGEARSNPPGGNDAAGGAAVQEAAGAPQPSPAPQQAQAPVAVQAPAAVRAAPAAPAAPSAPAAAPAPNAPAAAPARPAAAPPPATRSAAQAAAPAPTRAPLTSPPGSGWVAASLDAARDASGIQLLLPGALGEPDEVYVRSDGGAAIQLVYGEPAGLSGARTGPTVRLTESPTPLDGPDAGEPVAWPGGQGKWEPASDDGGRLQWVQGGIQLVLDTRLPKEQAVAIAASVAAGE
jgi:hypothetical protein